MSDPRDANPWRPFASWQEQHERCMTEERLYRAMARERGETHPIEAYILPEDK